MNVPPPFKEHDDRIAIQKWEPHSAVDLKAIGRFRLQRFDDIHFTTRANYMVKGLLPRVGIAVVWGAPKCGKSFWVFDLAMHVALGRDYRGHRVKAGPVVYCALEGAEGFRARVEAFRQAKLDGNASPPFRLMSSPLKLIADEKAFIEALREQTRDAPPALVVIDTLNRSLDGSENEDKDMSSYIKAADAIRDAFDCLVLIVHHCGHEGSRPRGHSSLMGAVDVQISVKRDAANNIVAELELAKDDAPGLQFVSNLECVDIGHDEDGDPVTSCVVWPADDGDAAGAPTTRLKLGKGAQIALRALEVAVAECGKPPPASNYVPRSAKIVRVETWRTYAYKSGISESSEPRAQQQAFKRAHEALLASGIVREWDGSAWIVV